MGRKRLTRAQTQHELDLVLDQLRENDAYGDEVLAKLRADLGSSVHPQQMRATLENAEQLNEYYKELSEVFKAKTAQEAEEAMDLEDDIKAAERATFILRDEVEILKLKKVDPELDDKLQQIAAKLKERLLEYPTLLGAVTGDEQFMQGIKKSYESKIEDFETKLNGLINDVFELPFDWSSKLSTVLADFTETTIMPAIRVVKVQHEQLEKKVGEANEETTRLKEQIEDMKADAQRARGEIRELKERLEYKDAEHQAVKKMLEAEREVNKTQNEAHKLEMRATKTSDQMTRLLQWHVSALDNISMGELESGEVLREMGVIVGTMERYAGPTTGAVSMPKHMPGMTLVWKATAIPEPNLAAARRLWLSSRCDSMILDVAQAFFMRQEIPSVQFALLPWIHASLSRAVITICERSTITTDLTSTLLCILQGLVYTATVAREWSDDHAWISKVEELLTKIHVWLGEHVPNDEASILMMIADQVNDIVNKHESPSTSISPDEFEESQRIDSGNSDIPEGMALVVDISGILILFTVDNAFIFGTNEVKVLEINIAGTMVIKFDQAVIGLPTTLMELQLLDLNSPAEVIKRHQALLKSVLTQDRIEYTYSSKRRRMR